MKRKYFVHTSLCLVFFLPLLNHAQGIINGTGSSLVANGNISIVIENGGLKNDGTFVKGSSTVHFLGSNATSSSSISGTGAVTFNNLTMNKSANGIQLNRDIDVSGIVNFQNGDSIFLNNYNLNLGTTGNLSGERATCRFTGLNGGYVMITQTLNAPVLANPGNIGIEISSAANLGSTIIKRSHPVFKNASIKRSFEITPTTNTGLNASLNFYYFLPELNGISEVLLSTYASTNSGSNWNYATNIVPNTTSHFITTNNTNSLSLFTLFPTGINLPVELLYFKGIKNDNSNLLSWATATEQNNSFFYIERSVDGVFFEEIGRVSGAGNSVSIIQYEYQDKVPLKGKTYYRLKHSDFDNYDKYSFTISIVRNSKEQPLYLYPNPAIDVINIQTKNQNLSGKLFIIVDCYGKTVKRFKIQNSIQPITKTALPIADLKPGLYYLRSEESVIPTTNFFIKQ
jgi:Secretion system C-terminal sorting domain